MRLARVCKDRPPGGLLCMKNLLFPPPSTQGEETGLLPSAWCRESPSSGLGGRHPSSSKAGGHRKETAADPKETTGSALNCDLASAVLRLAGISGEFMGSIC